MKRRAIVGMSIAVVSLAATALRPLSGRLRLNSLTPSELSLKPILPPNDSCFQVQRTLADLSLRAVRPLRELAPLGVDERAIYTAVLERWNPEPLKRLNVSNRTVPLDHNISDCTCLTAVDLASFARATRSFHLLSPDVLTSKSIKLVDAELQRAIVQTNDPHNSMSQGLSVHAAVDRAFADGLFQLSEIAFDREHRRAILSYSFVCGSLCGSGGVWLFDKVDGVWKRLEHDCGGWVS
jgi:hypothetical protein